MVNGSCDEKPIPAGLVRRDIRTRVGKYMAFDDKYRLPKEICGYERYNRPHPQTLIKTAMTYPVDLGLYTVQCRRSVRCLSLPQTPRPHDRYRSCGFPSDLQAERGPYFLALTPPAALMAFTISARTPMLLVIGSVLLGIVFWVAGLTYFEHPLMQEAKLSMRRFARRPRV